MGKILQGIQAKKFSFSSAVKAIKVFYEENGKDRKTRQEVKKFIFGFFGQIRNIEIS